MAAGKAQGVDGRSRGLPKGPVLPTPGSHPRLPGQTSDLQSHQMRSLGFSEPLGS